MTASGNTWPTCTACGRGLREHEADRGACRLCQRRTDDQLRSLTGPTGLYAALAHTLQPGNSPTSSRVSGNTRTAPLPVRLEPLSLSSRGGIVTILQTWLVDWHDQLDWPHPRWEGDLQQQLDQAVTALRANLEWAASAHPAFAEFAQEVNSLVRQCECQVTGERPERRVTLACPCGATIRITLSTPGTRCPACATQYDRTTLLNLPLAQRAAAA